MNLMSIEVMENVIAPGFWNNVYNAVSDFVHGFTNGLNA